VLSSFADPLANNGRGQTTVELGCLLTYMEDAAEPAELNTRDDDELGNDTQADEDFDAIGASISAKYIFKQCAAAIGVTYSFNDGPLASTFRLDTIDLEVGYVSVMSDLLVSESMVGELDGNEVLQIRALTEAVGEAGKLLNTTNVLSIAPLNAGELPGENVAVQYSSWRLKEPDPDDGFGDNRWELSVTTGPIVRYYVQSGDDVFRLEGRSTTETRTTYESAVVDGKTISRVKEVETVKDIPEVEVAGEYYTALLEVFGSVPVDGWGQGLDGVPQSPTDRSIEITTYEYRPDGKVSSVIRRKTETWLAIVGRMNITLAWPPTVLNPPDGFALSEISETRYLYADVSITTFGSGGAGSFNRPDRVRRIEQEDFVMYPFTQEGQQAAAAGNARSDTKEHAISQIRGMIDTGLISRGVIVTNEYSSDDPDNVVPSEIERSNSIGGTDDPLERSTETVWVYGDQQSIRRRVFRMPFAPDDLVTGTSGNYTVTPSNAEDVARLFGRVQNKLLFGARYGVQLQLLPVQVPAMAFDALNVDLAGVMGQFRLNNLSYVIEPGEVVCGCNALYWGTIGSTPYSGTASGSWVPLPASSSGYTAPQDMNTVEAGTTFVISSVGTTSQEDWNTLAGTSGVTYSEGDTITAVVDGSTLDSSTGTVSTLQPAPTPTSDPTLGEVVTTDPEDVQPPYTTTERYALAAYRGRFVLSGTETATRLALRFGLAADSRAFVLSGRPVTLRKSIQYQLAANAAAFVITGNDADVVHGYNLGPAAGAYVMTGQDAALATTGAASFELLGVTGSFALTGNEAELNPTILTPLPGSFALSGNDVDLSLFAVEPFNGFGAKYTDPATLPTNDANGVAFSPSGEAIAVAFRSSPFIAAYPWDAATGFGTKYSNPATAVPGFSGEAVAFSPAGDAIAIAIDDETCVAVYAWDDATGFGAKYSDPSTAIVGDYGRDVAFSPSGNAIAVSHGFTQPSVSAYAWDASTGFGTKYSNPASTPEFAFDSENVAFTPAGDAIAVTFDDTPGIVVYSWDDATGFGVQYSDPATEAPIGSDDLAFSPAGDAIASTDVFAPRVYACSWDSATGFGAKYTDPSTAVPSAGQAVAFSPLSDAILIGYTGAPYISAYAWDSTTGFGAKFSDPATAPTGRVNDIAFSPTGDAVAIAHNTSPRITVYANADPS
jgi:hypothetical protein